MRDDPRRKETIIMCVDDDLTIREIAKEGLGAAGYQVLLCRDGEECLSQLTRYAPKVILLDIDMPRLNGLRTLEQIRNGYPALDARIVMLTADSSKESIEEARQFGASDYVIKPFSISHLVKRVDHWAGLLTKHPSRKL
jgi:CheY-like chemotaxis protein